MTPSDPSRAAPLLLTAVLLLFGTGGCSWQPYNGYLDGEVSSSNLLGCRNAAWPPPNRAAQILKATTLVRERDHVIVALRPRETPVVLLVSFRGPTPEGEEHWMHVGPSEPSSAWLVRAPTQAFGHADVGDFGHPVTPFVIPRSDLLSIAARQPAPGGEEVFELDGHVAISMTDEGLIACSFDLRSTAPVTLFSEYLRWKEQRLREQAEASTTVPGVLSKGQVAEIRDGIAELQRCLDEPSNERAKVTGSVRGSRGYWNLVPL